jgi:hypothetical protein
MPEPNQPAATTADPKTTNPLRTPRQCRYVKTSGEQCRAQALLGNHYCYTHKYNRKRVYAGVKGYDRVAFLEDTASIQLSLSQIMQGLLEGKIDRHTAGTAFYGFSVAAGVVRTDLMRERWLAESKRPIPESVTEIVEEECDNLAPEKEYRGPTGVFEPQWSWSKYMYEKECEQLGLPKPTCAADFPESGWLTEEEINTDPAKLVQGYHARIRAETDRLFFIRKAESAAALAAGLPDPHEHLKADNPDCPSRTKICGGPLAFSACPDCRAKRTPGMGFDDLDSEVFNEEPELEDPIADPTDLDLKASADSSSELCALSSEPCPEPCALSSEPCPEPCSQVPKEKRYPPTCTKQTTCRAYPRGEGDTHPPCSCRSAVPGALHHAQVPAPRPNRIPVLMREDPRDLVQMGHIVRSPGSE